VALVLTLQFSVIGPGLD